MKCGEAAKKKYHRATERAILDKDGLVKPPVLEKETPAETRSAGVLNFSSKLPTPVRAWS